MKMHTLVSGAFSAALLTVALSLPAYGADNLRLNDHLDYSSDSQDGPLITGENMNTGLAANKPNYVIIYGEGCFNSKRQAERTVDLYKAYKDRVNFVVIDLDHQRPALQQELVKRFYGGYIPHVAVVGASGDVLYNHAGEIGTDQLTAILNKALK